MGASLWSLLIFSLIIIIWLVPLFIVASSNKVSGTEKLAWIIAMIFISWFSFILYLLLAPIKEKAPE